MNHNQMKEKAKKLIEYKNEKAVINSIAVSKIFGKRHDSVIRSIENLLRDKDHEKFNLHNFVEIKIKDNRGVRTTYDMTRSGASAIVLAFTGKKARDFRIPFVEAFDEMERRLMELSLNKQSWSQARLEGKGTRRLVTDLIKAFEKYATNQGSRNAKMYYMNFSKLVNKELLEIIGKAPKDVRDQCNTFQLHSISVAETLIAKTLSECMAQNRYYKDIYKIAKDRIHSLALTIGKTKLGQTDREIVGLIA